MDAKDFNRLPKWQSTLLVVAAIGAIGLLRIGMTVDVAYEIAPVATVEPIAGRTGDRLVTIEIAGEPRHVRASDWKIEAEPGRYVCVETRSRLFRRGKRLSLALPFYCRKALAARGQGAYL